MASRIDIDRTWTLDKELRDVARWVGLVPKKNRALVEKWIARCGDRGRRRFWSWTTADLRAGRKTEKQVANELVLNAGFRNEACLWCDSSDVVTIDAHAQTSCARCLSPGDLLLFDAR